MTRYVALLRGVNVGGVVVPMARLRELAVGHGYGQVATYLNSGNLLLDAGRTRASTVARDVSALLTAEFGRSIPVVVRTAPELAATLEQGRLAFPDVEASRLQLAFLDRAAPEDADELIGDFAPDLHARLERDLALHYPDGMARSKLTTNVIESRLGRIATVRGSKTVVALIERLG